MNREILKIREDSSEKYNKRTYYNAKSADLTLALAVDFSTLGEKCTKNAAGDKYIGFLLNQEANTLDIARGLYKKLKSLNAKKLNIAGNGIYTLHKHNCDQHDINDFVYDIIKKVHEHWPLEKIYTGGQTGLDLAGAVAGYLLEIPTEVTLPKGYKQRFEDKIDVNGTEETVFKQIEEGAVKILSQEKNEKQKIKI